MEKIILKRIDNTNMSDQLPTEIPCPKYGCPRVNCVHHYDVFKAKLMAHLRNSIPHITCKSSEAQRKYEIPVQTYEQKYQPIEKRINDAIDAYMAYCETHPDGQCEQMRELLKTLTSEANADNEIVLSILESHIDHMVDNILHATSDDDDDQRVTKFPYNQLNVSIEPVSNAALLNGKPYDLLVMSTTLANVLAHFSFEEYARLVYEYLNDPEEYDHNLDLDALYYEYAGALLDICLTIEVTGEDIDMVIGEYMDMIIDHIDAHFNSHPVDNYTVKVTRTEPNEDEIPNAIKAETYYNNYITRRNFQVIASAVLQHITTTDIQLEMNACGINVHYYGDLYFYYAQFLVWMSSTVFTLGEDSKFKWHSDAKPHYLRHYMHEIL